MKKIRHSCFETNSSSSHCLAIRDGVDTYDTSIFRHINKDGILDLTNERCDFGWEYEKLENSAEKAVYLYHSRQDIAKDVILEYTKALDVIFPSDGYIDHQSVDELGKLTAQDAKEFVFNPNWIMCLGNDNESVDGFYEGIQKKFTNDKVLIVKDESGKEVFKEHYSSESLRLGGTKDPLSSFLNNNAPETIVTYFPEITNAEVKKLESFGMKDVFQKFKTIFENPESSLKIKIASFLGDDYNSKLWPRPKIEVDQYITLQGYFSSRVSCGDGKIRFFGEASVGRMDYPQEVSVKIDGTPYTNKDREKIRKVFEAIEKRFSFKETNYTYEIKDI